MPLEIKHANKLRLADSLEIAESVKDRYEPLLPAMRLFYNDVGWKMADEDLFLAVDARFGDDMIVHVCEPLGFFEGACAFIGAVLLRQEDRRELRSQTASGF